MKLNKKKIKSKIFCGQTAKYFAFVLFDHRRWVLLQGLLAS